MNLIISVFAGVTMVLTSIASAHASTPLDSSYVPPLALGIKAKESVRLDPADADDLLSPVSKMDPDDAEDLLGRKAFAALLPSVELTMSNSLFRE